MKHYKPNRQRASLRQRFSRKMIVITGISVALISMMLIIYFQFFKNEPLKAKEKQILTVEEMPVDLHIEEPFIARPDTQLRNGLRYKTAKPLQLTPQITE